MNITHKDLLDAGVHFGHQIRRWNPAFRPFLFDHRNGISIIDLEKTYNQLESAAGFLTDVVRRGQDVMFVGTKRQAQELMREAAAATSMPFSVNRWMGGTLTNFDTIKASLAKYRRFIAMENDGSLAKLPKKEGAAIRRQMVRMNRNFEGFLEMNQLPGALIVIDVNHEEIAVREARRLGIPVVGLVDTNSDPATVDYPIPGNDDAAKSIGMVVDVLVEAIQSGLENREIAASGRVPVAILPRREFEEQTSAEVTLPEGYEDPEEEQS